VAQDAHDRPAMAHVPDSPITADDALHRLIEGNARYRAGHSRFTGLRPEMLEGLAHGQQPFATILGCADSRVPPELVFDAVLGELFVVRVAGNVMSPEVAGSLQYADVHLDTPLFMVLGHEGCGAVQASLEAERHGAQFRSRIQHLVDVIAPALDGVDLSLEPKQQLAWAVEANVRWTMRLIAESPEGRARLESGRMMLVGAVYDLATGHVRLLDLA
jgi:carbonic anhydrase